LRPPVRFGTSSCERAAYKRACRTPRPKERTMIAITLPTPVRRQALRSRMSLLRAIFSGRGYAGWVEAPAALEVAPSARTLRMLRNGRAGAW
jgi:hypothetical protein